MLHECALIVQIATGFTIEEAMILSMVQVRQYQSAAMGFFNNS